jgi:transcriptional regulator GlxA family with amidase domain
MSVHTIHAASPKRCHVAHACNAAALPSRHLASLDLIGALIDAASGPERSQVFGRWLESRIGERRPLGWQAERVVAAAVSLLDAADTPVDELARQHRVSRRQLERDFQRCLGVAPGSYARLVRFQRAARAIADGMPLAHVAAEQGYADQAHMTRAFGDIAGVTPRHLRKGGGAATALRSVFANRMIMLPASVSAAAGPPALRLAA